MDQVRSSIREVAVLQQATQMILSSLDLDTVLHHILLVVRNYFGASRCAVFLVDSPGNQLICRAQNGYDGNTAQQRFPIGKDSVAGWAAFTRSPLYIPDFSRESRHRPASDQVCAQLALPLVVRDRVIGVLDMASDKLDPFDSEAIGLLSLFAGQASIALENTRLHSTELRRMRQMELLNLIARSAAAALDTPQFFSTLADLISDTFEGTQVAIVLISPEDASLVIPAHSGNGDLDLQRFITSGRTGALCEAFSHRTPVVVDEAASRPGWVPCFAHAGSEMCVPLTSFGEVLGAVVLAHADARFFGPEDRSLAQAAADVCATAARNVQLSEELRRVANLDPLTGIFNQRYFHSAVAHEIPRARRHKKQFGLILLDLRHMRRVNSQLGMDQGDQLLRNAAAALKSGIRNNDVLCRYVSDRFALLLPEVESQGLSVVLTKLQAALENVQVKSSRGSQALTATGATAHFPEDGSDEIELLKLLFSRLEATKQLSSGASAG